MMENLANTSQLRINRIFTHTFFYKEKIVITKKRHATGLIFLASSIFLASIAMAQTTDELITEDSIELEIVESSGFIECITSDQYDALSEEKKVNQELPLCNETIVTEVTTEELAEETNHEISTEEQDMVESQCLTLAVYDAMTLDERASVEIPICDE